MQRCRSDDSGKSRTIPVDSRMLYEGSIRIINRSSRDRLPFSPSLAPSLLFVTHNTLPLQIIPLPLNRLHTSTMDYLKSRLQPDINIYASKTAGLGAYVDTSSAWLWVCLASIVFNPVFWNTVARNGESAVRESFDAERLVVVSAVSGFRRVGSTRLWLFWHAISIGSHSNIPNFPLLPTITCATPEQLLNVRLPS